MRPKLRERPASRQAFPEGRHFCHVSSIGEENPLACRPMQHGRVEGDLTARIDRRDNRLRGDVEPIETSAARCWCASLDDGA
jgi:hypothetical protein